MASQNITRIVNTKYSVEIEVTKFPDMVFNHVIDLSKWWVEEFVGEELKFDSEFL